MRDTDSDLRDKRSLNLPDRIGPYPVVEELGRGGMGVVYLAEDTKLRRRIAVKVLPNEMAQDAEGLVRFEREAQLLASINHPSIATIYSLEETDDHTYLTMEHIPGDSLDRLIAAGPLSIDTTLSIGRQIASALEGAHREQVIHRDLKPANIMVAPDGTVKILDFGLAKTMSGGEEDPAELLRSEDSAGLIIGTLGYMSPEQLRGLEVDHRSDIWAFACILYECLTGDRVFPGATPSDRIAATLKQEPDWSALPSNIPDRLRLLISQCLAKDSGARPASVAIARREIEEVIAQRGQPAETPSQQKRRAATTGNLPLQLSSFIGREKQMADLKELLARNRLVTLTGAGGSGKTRLAIETARELPETPRDGVWLAALSQLTDETLLPKTVAAALGVSEEPNRTVTETLIDHLNGKELLLILDNCEHLVAACADLVDLFLRTHPQIRVLATSRQGLGITGEAVYRVPPLALPDPGARLGLHELAAIESIRLFAERGRSVRTDFALTEENAPAVVQVCRRLDGIPLALELAAARVEVLTAEEIAGRLDDRFRLLTTGGPTSQAQHKTLRALIDWSHDILTEPERVFLRRLAVFAGGWTLDAAESVCSGDGIEGWEVLDLLSCLVAKSLVEMDVDGGRGTGRARYRMLETIREYARDRLRESGERPAVRRRHRDYYVALAEEAESELTGSDQATWLARLQAEHDNLRAACAACTGEDGGIELGLRLVGALGRFLQVRGHWSEGRRLFATFLDAPGGGSRTAARGKTLNWAGNLAYMQGDSSQARVFHEVSLEIRRELGDEEGVAETLSNMGNVAFMQGRPDAARAFFKESLEIRRELDDRRGIAVSLNNLGVIAERQGDYPDALRFFEESLEIERELGDRWGIALSLNNVGLLAARIGDHAKALGYYEECLRIARELGDQSCIAQALNGLATLSLRQDDPKRAWDFFAEALAIQRALGNQWGIAESLNNLGYVAVKLGEHAEAGRLHAESLTLARELGSQPGIAMSLGAFGMLARSLGAPRRAARLYAVSQAMRKEIGVPIPSDERQELEDDLAMMRRELGEDVFATEWAAGKEMTVEQAIEYALSEERER